MKEETRKELYSFIKKADEKLKYDAKLLNVISYHWEVYKMPSTGEDHRYKILGDEIEKHYILNDDWPQDKLYIKILKVMDDEQRLLRFVSDLMNMEEVRIDGALIRELRNTLNREGLDVIEMNNHLFIGNDSKASGERSNNKIPFVLCKSNITHIVNFAENCIQMPKEEKCYVVTFNEGWNDYDWCTWFRIYYKDDEHLYDIGSVKIMKGNEENTRLTLPDRFYSLNDEYCSLGYDIYYYLKVYELFGDKSMEFLSLLQDAATNNLILDRNTNLSAFKNSLIRFNCSERALREGRFYANGREMINAYSFTFRYATPYRIDKEERIDIDFDFQYGCPSFKRVIGLIGENGVGKSSLIESLSLSIAKKAGMAFVREAPIFSKVTVLSFSPFDVYPNSCMDSVIEYRYCGLMKSKNELLSLEEQTGKFKDNLKCLIRRDKSDHLMRIWNRIIKDVVSDDTIDSFFVYDGVETKIAENTIDEFCKNMSSGESIFVYSMTEIIANIRYDSLIMFDEPEQHLHPHAITKLLRAIYRVLDIFESYAIIATHSPLVIREMMSDNVLVFSRVDKSLDVAKIGIESFGEDVSVLSDVVFKNMNDEKRYEHVIMELADRSNNNYDAIVEALQGKHNKLGLSARLLIRTIVENRQQ